MKVQCSNCRKKFDYDNFYGLCPKCGAYNAKPAGEVHEDLHRFYGETGGAVRPHLDTYRREELLSAAEKTSYKDTYSKGQKEIGSVILLVLTLVTAGVVLLCLLGAFSFIQKRKAIPDTAGVEVVGASGGDQLVYGDYMYNVGDAVIVADALQDKRLPKGTKLAAIYLMMVYTGEHDEYENRFMPYVYDGKKYVEAAEQFELSEIAREYGLPGENLDSYDVYVASQRAYEGYVLYLIDQECEEIVLNLECREQTFLKRIYEVPLIPYECEELSDGIYGDGEEDFWGDDDLFDDFGEYYNWYEFFDDDYDEYYEDDDYGIRNMKVQDAMGGNLS